MVAMENTSSTNNFRSMVETKNDDATKNKYQSMVYGLDNNI